MRDRQSWGGGEDDEKASIAQLSLFELLSPVMQPSPPPNGNQQTMAERFADFHDTNPHVYVALLGLALEAKRNGFKRWSINGMFEVLRWRYAMQTQGDEYKLNNNHRSFYARLLMESPDLAGFFETREKRRNGREAE